MTELGELIRISGEWRRVVRRVRCYVQRSDGTWTYFFALHTEKVDEWAQQKNA